MGKIIKRTLLGLLILIVLVLGAAILLPIIYKTKIIEFAKSEANRRINAKLNFSNDISIGILKTFPDLNITINNITLVNNKPFAGDTLISIVEFKSTMDVMSIIKGDKIKIKTLVLNHPRIFMKKLIDGTANWSIAFPSNEDIKAQGKDTGSNFKMGLQHYEINNGYVVFDDATHTFYAKMVNLNHSGNGDFTADNLDLNTETTADAITMIYDKIPYLYNTKTQLKAAINIDQKISKYTLKENELHLNDLLITFGGWVAMPDDDINMDMNFKSPQTDFKSILSLIPAVYKKDFSKIKASGSMAMKGDIKGTYNDKSFPGFNVLLNVDNGMFSYPDLPTPVKDVFVNMTAQSPGGDFNNAVINISKLHFAMGDDPFDIRMLIKTPTTDPYLDGAIKGKIILDNIKNMVKLDAGTSISGILKSDILMKGNLSSIEKKEYDKFNFSGNITCENLGYTSASLPQKMHISHTSMDFNPKNVKLNDLSMTIGNSDMQMDGYLNNLLGYFFKKGQTLKGELNLTAKLIDCNQFLSKSTAKEASHEDPNAKPSAVELPGDIDFTLKAKLGEVKYEKFDFKNLRGQITLADKRITFKDAALSLMDATCNIDGYYDSKNIKEPKVDMKVAVNNINIKDAYDAFESMKKFAPIAQYVKGNMDMNIKFNSELGEDMKPLWNTFNSRGSLNLKDATLEAYEPFNEVAGKLNMPEFHSVSLRGVRPAFKIEDGKLELEDSIRFKVKDVMVRLGGYTTLEQMLFHDMVMNVPVQHLKEQANGELNKVMKNQNIDIPIGKTVRVDALIRGNIKKPTIKFSLKNLAGNLKDAIKDKVKQEFDKQKKELERKANEEKDKAIQQGEAKKKELENQARQRAEEEKRKQEEAIRQKAEEEKTKLKEQGKNKLKDLFKK